MFQIIQKNELYGNYPNPFNPKTTINFSIAKKQKVLLEIYDITGRIIEKNVWNKLNAGKHSYEFDAFGLASGIYLYKLITEKFYKTKKMIVIK